MLNEKPLANCLLMAFLLLVNIIGGSVIDRVAGLYVTNQEDGILSVEAAQDINLKGAVISNAAADGITQLVANDGSVNIGTVTVEKHEEAGDAKNYRKDHRTTDVGSLIDVSNNLLVKAGTDVNIVGSELNSDFGDVVIHAGNNVTITEGRDTQDLESAAAYSSKKLLGKRSDTYNFTFDKLKLTTEGKQTVSVKVGKLTVDVRVFVQNGSARISTIEKMVNL